MAKILDMPKLSPTMEEGVLSAWHKKEGDEVGVDDLLAEVETDKATMEFRAFDKGTLLKLLVAAGTTVKLGQAVAILGDAGEDVTELIAKAGGGAAPATKAEAKTETKAVAKAGDDESAPEGKAGDAREDAKSESESESDSKSEDEAAANPPPAAKGAATPPKAASPAPAANANASAVAKPASGGAHPSDTLPPPAVRRQLGSVLDRTEREPVSSPGASGGGEGGAGDRERVMASPYVRKIAREMGVDLHGAHGSGPGGRIVADDLEAMKRDAKALARSPAPNTLPGLVRAPAPAASSLHLAEPEVRPLSPMRKTIARRLTESKQTVPHFYLTIDVDAAELVRLREEINAQLAGDDAPAKRGESQSAKAEGGEKPLKVSVNDLLIKACATALSRVPECNAQYTPEAILVHRRVDISVAVAVAEGLLTPVVRNADQKSVVAIAREVRELAARARTKKLKLEEMQDGTFSISNLGMFGIDQFAAVINPPEGAILAVGQVREEPVVKDGQIAIGKKLMMTLSCDHRVVDGAVGAAFLAELRGLIERPLRVLTG